jgi:hypothetical protein
VYGRGLLLFVEKLLTADRPFPQDGRGLWASQIHL